VVAVQMKFGNGLLSGVIGAYLATRPPDQGLLTERESASVTTPTMPDHEIGIEVADALQAQPIPFTEDAAYPSWSPIAATSGFPAILLFCNGPASSDI
jgi:hypothetical protein